MSNEADFEWKCLCGHFQVDKVPKKDCTVFLECDSCHRVYQIALEFDQPPKAESGGRVERSKGDDIHIPEPFELKDRVATIKGLK